MSGGASVFRSIKQLQRFKYERSRYRGIGNMVCHDFPFALRKLFSDA
jgi:hypothetical protein